MEHNEFDHIIKHKLSELPSDFSANMDWDHMDALMEREKDAAFDEQVANKLKSLVYSGFHEGNWDTLYALITKRIAFKRIVLTNKLSELVLLALLLLLGFQTPFFTIKKPTEDADEKPALIASLSEKEQLTNEDGQFSSTTANLHEEHVVHNPEHNFTSSTEDVLNRPAAKSKELVADSRLEHIEPSLLNRLTFEPIQGRNIVFSAKSSEKNANALYTENSGPEAFKDVNLLASGDISLVTSMQSNSLRVLPELTEMDVILASAGDKYTSSISLYNHTKYNFINLPESSLVPRSTYLSSNLFSSVGLGYLFQYGNWGAVFGMEHNKIKYETAFSSIRGNLTQPYVQTTLSSLQFDLISLPFDVMYSFINFGKNKLSIVGGISSEILARTQYNFEIRNLETEEVILSDRPRDINKDSKLAGLNYKNGIFNEEDSRSPIASPESSSFWDSIFFRARIGMDYTRKLNRSFSLRFQGIYLHQLNPSKGIGPNSDVFNAFSCNIGVQYRLG